MLDPDPVNPTLTATWGSLMRPYPLDPSSRIVVGWEDPSAPLMSNHSRHATFVVSELAALSLDLDRVVVAT